MTNTVITTSTFNITRGDTVTFQLSFVDDNNNPIDITGWEFFLTFKENLTDPDILAPVQMYYTNIDAPTTGVVKLELPAYASKDLVVGNMYCDFQAKIPAQSTTHDDIILTVWNGVATVISDVTVTQG